MSRTCPLLLVAALCTALLSTSACTSDKPAGATCETVAGHLLQLRGAERAQREAPPMSEAGAAREWSRSVARCQDRTLTAAARACVIAAADRAAVAACEAGGGAR